MDYVFITEYVINIFNFLLIVFIDALPWAMFPNNVRRWYFLLWVPGYIFYGVLYSFFAEPYEKEIFGQKWLLTDIRASVWWSMTIFVCKILWASFLYPGSLTVGSCTLKFVTSPDGKKFVNKIMAEPNTYNLPQPGSMVELSELTSYIAATPMSLRNFNFYIHETEEEFPLN